MPAPVLYADHNVSLTFIRHLRMHGYQARAARDERREGASDAAQVLHAAPMGWLLITHNEADFRLLFDAWHRWSQAWDVPRHHSHSGILIVPQRWEPQVRETMVLALLSDEPDFTDRLCLWHSGQGWAFETAATLEP